MLFDRSNYIIIEKELFPYAPYWVEKLCLGNKKYIIDIDDAVFLNYEQSRNKHIRKFLGNKFNQLFANSSAVLAGSPYLVEKARQAAASKVIYYPTVIELDKYNPSQLAHVRTNANEFIIGWIGSNSTVKYLQVVHEALSILSNKFSDQCKLKLYIIGAQLDWRIPGVEVKLIPWSEASEVTEIYKIDVGIMPLEDTQWERGKCAYKLIQYMACSKPVIASKVGANNYVVQPGNNGFLCDGVAEWVAAFSELIEQPEMQIKLGHNGRLRVEREFTVDANLQLMHQLLMIEQL